MSEDPRNFRLLLILLAAALAAPILLTAGRGIMCIIRNGCPFSEYSFAMEQFGSYIAILVALLSRGR